MTPLDETQYPISLIAAVADNGVIGYKNQLPWHLPEDLAHFKKLTIGKPILMGRNTYESIGKPLPHRLNIVISKKSALNETHQLKQAHNLSEALQIAKDYYPNKSEETHSEHNKDFKQEIMVIGGAQLYQASLALANHVYMTQVHLQPEGDCHFTAWQSNAWELENKSERLTSNNNISYTFMRFKRSSPEAKV